MVSLGNDWDELLAGEFSSDYYKSLHLFLKEEYRRLIVYPDMYDIFNSLRLTPMKAVRAVILGQDPYHGAGQAHGLCFSVKKGVLPPPSLQNIFKELESDIGMSRPASGDLTAWANQGVLLLNTTMTVREGQPLSHKGKGWETFTDHIISLLDKKSEPVVFLLWGTNARSKKSLIVHPQHLVLEATHPSPLSAYHSFFGCKHFSKANAFLKANGRGEINWSAICYEENL